ncbi:unnamed protein product [Dovyalis caffra]|uniref:DUF3511 domain protein n=1 Tax=Dovyalis caffra TaxID=77055 RepID=A0AAV1RV99_9ROSI|nr:unnamed protein product [Dovyalis caffra]
MGEINVYAKTVTPPRHAKSCPSYDFSRKHNVSKKSSSSATSWWNSPETKRKKRVARYKLYTVEGKVKSSLKKGFRWVKRTCYRIIHL